jgi:lipoate-protein ligase A
MHGEFKVPRGKLVVADLEVDGDRLRDVRITGDFFIYPEEALGAITESLEGAPAALQPDEYCLRVAEAVPVGAELLGVSPAAIAIAVSRAQEPETDAE